MRTKLDSIYDELKDGMGRYKFYFYNNYKGNIKEKLDGIGRSKF